MIVTVFKSRLRSTADEEAMEQLGQYMYELASAMPGFVSYKDYMAGDGEIVTIVEFETLKDVEAWRDHPEHKAVQQRGKTEFFSEYHIQVCDTIRDYSFSIT